MKLWAKGQFIKNTLQLTEVKSIALDTKNIVIKSIAKCNSNSLITSDELITKYQLALPFDTHEAFEIFDNHLRTNSEAANDIVKTIFYF